MNKEVLLSDEIRQFLDDVKGQIQYKPIRIEIEDELKAHIEDRTLEYIDMGMEEHEASHKALLQMGDASSIGIMLNDARHVKNSYPLLFMVLASIFFGILRNFLDYSVDWDHPVYSILYNVNYFIFGLIVLAAVYYRGYTFIIMHLKGFLISMLFLFFANAIITNYFTQYTINYSSHVLTYNLLLLLGPVFSASVYRWRSRGKLVLLYYFPALVAVLLPQRKYYSNYFTTAELTLIITGIVTLFFLSYRNYLSEKKRSFIICLLTGFTLSAGLYIGTSYTVQKENLQLFLHPQEQATSHWQDGYNGVLIKELLGRAEAFGSIKLSKDELYHYGSGAWYFKEDEVNNITKYIHYTKENVTLTDILPQHYHNNYRIAYWILAYGWIPGLLLLAFVLGLYILLFIITGKIKNKLGKTLALGCSVCLSAQMLFYLMGNFGHQYGSFSTLPFISEGVCSITTNMFLGGLVLSAYRYDHVIREEALIKHKPKRIISRMV